MSRGRNHVPSSSGPEDVPKHFPALEETEHPVRRRGERQGDAADRCGVESRPVNKSDPHIVLGVDLAGSPRRPTGLCLLLGNRARTSVAFDDEEILALARKTGPALVAVDAPLHLPPGRSSIDDRNGQHFRLCDIELRRRKIRFFPVTLGPMRMLTVRGMMLKSRLEELGLRVVEIYPGGAQDVWGIPRAGHDLAGLLGGLRRLGIRGLGRKVTADELDAVSGALVGRLFLAGKADVLGDFETGAIVMPPPPGDDHR